MERLPELIVPFKREVYEDVCAHFAHMPRRFNARSQIEASNPRYYCIF